MLAQLTKWLRPNPLQEQVAMLYVALVAQARQPAFYQQFAVLDTIDGRFDMIALHYFLLHQANLQRQDASELHLSQLLMERMIDDMDRSLREMGAGDTSIGKKVQKMAYAINGRLQRYMESWQDESAFAEALMSNLYRKNDGVDAEIISRLIRYCRACTESLAESPLSPPLRWAELPEQSLPLAEKRMVSPGSPASD